MNTLTEVALILLSLGIILFTTWLIHSAAKDDGYKQGQIDAINGKINYVLVEFEDGVREYREKTELKDLKPHKIIEQ